MIELFFIFIMATLLIAIVGTMYSGYKFNNNFLFGVSLPSYAKYEEEVTKLQEEYKKTCKKYGVIAAVLGIPVIFLVNSNNFGMILWILWLIGLIVTFEKPYEKMNKKLKEVKREKGWFIGSTREVLLDTKVSKMKASMSISVNWFLIPWAICIISFIIELYNKSSILKFANVIYPMIISISTVILMILFQIFKRAKVKVYSKNSEINLAINKGRKRWWSIFWFGIALTSNSMLLITQIVMNSTMVNVQVIYMLFIPLYLVCTILWIMYSNNKMKDLEEELIIHDKGAVYVDGDEYWIKGTLYCNPNDRSIFVEKPFGVGATVNIGTTAGKIIYYLSNVLIVVIFGVMLFFMVGGDIFSPTITMDHKNISIDYVMYDFSFDMNEIEDVTLIDKLPRGVRINGVSTPESNIGNYNIDGYGKSKLYIYNESSPIIMIKLKDLYVFYNCKENKDTLELYDRIIGENY